MDKTLPTPPPYFDRQEARATLTGFYRELSGRETKLRRAVLDYLKGLTEAAHLHAERQLFEDGSGRACAEGLSEYQDELINLIYDFAVKHIYFASNPSTSEKMTIVATGGYGRNLLAPGSDLDLLFLLPHKQTAWGESVTEYILYMLWDLGFKVGHATRTVRECVHHAKSDMTIRTSLLDGRFILGERSLFDDFESHFVKDVVAGTAAEFIEAKLDERDIRHRRSGESRYRVEPNIKDGKGGLRDLHTLHWLAKYLNEGAPSEIATATGFFTAEEYHTFRKCEDFLWTIRCHLHFITKRPEERLTFDHQPIMAERLNYKSHGGLQAVERFMKHYFLVAKDVGDLTRILCSELEIRELKSTPRLKNFLNPLAWRSRDEKIDLGDFRIKNGRITINDDDIFRTSPINMINLFLEADKNDVLLHPRAIRQLRGSLSKIDDNLRNDPEANKSFLELLTSSSNAERSLRSMNESGVLGRFIPDFGRIVAMMQFNMYHHYTVDEHLLYAIGILSEIEQGILRDDHPLASKLIHAVKSRRVSYVAVLLHDIAKGREEDHSIAGARVARELCPRFGLTDEESDMVAWLVEQHLIMSDVSQRRDLSDPKTIRDFAHRMPSLEHLQQLLILTVVDIRAVGPGVWNGWKGELIRSLYKQTAPMLEDGIERVDTGEQIEVAKDKLRTALKDWPKDVLEPLIERQSPHYWPRSETSRHIRHIKLMRQATEGEKYFVADFITDEWMSISELTIFTPDHPHLIAVMAGACAAAGANIMGAQIWTTRDGWALNTFLLSREFDRDDDEIRRGERIAATIEKLLSGEMRLDKLLEGKSTPTDKVNTFDIPPSVHIDNNLSNVYTVIEVKGLDRPGFLYGVATALTELNLTVNSAQIVSYGEKVVDVFYVTDLTGGKIADPARQKTISNRLYSVI